jgi:anti-sigma-K factor RskA
MEILGRRVGVRKAMTTVHAYTSSQAIFDSPHTRARSGWAGAANLVPTCTGAAIATASAGTFVMALGFGPTAMEAGQHTLISLLEDFDETQAAYVRAWKSRWVPTGTSGAYCDTSS